ncbi:MAG: hypothetical protein UW24_C0007G0010 [Parcubacteria group bacterium GW2011_GWA2_44_12]|nr:MAG: hypothetical protein UW24_C0007G0010 [Parcubacteria group bacterium GW2011_GWA2_44_12]
MGSLLYRHNILDHYQNPRHFGKGDAKARTAEASNPMCGDKLTLYVDADQSGNIRAISFEGEGCAISMASASLLLENAMETNMSFDELCALPPSCVYDLLGVPISSAREDCALLILLAIKKVKQG